MRAWRPISGRRRKPETMISRTDTPGARAAIIAEAAAILKDGGVVVLPTDTVYGLAAHPDHPHAVARIVQIKGRAESKPMALLASRTASIEALGGTLSPAAQRLAKRFWPGALTLVVDCAETREGVRVPDHALTRDVIEACGGLLRVTSANRSGQPPALTAETAMRDVGQEADLVIDGGPVVGGTASTVVRDAPDGWHILREGAISAEALEQALDACAEVRDERLPPGAPAPLLLFVCTGNTCRSPMAEVLMRACMGSPARWRVRSAGTLATAGQPASRLAQQAVAEFGLDLAQHRSRPVTADMIEEARLVVAMGQGHVDHVAARCPRASEKLVLLRRFARQTDSLDVADPVGGSLALYRHCRDAINACLPKLAGFLNALA
jgi:tRNA threonylcarbamoyl adenosine modification protein (Sua5/YciO/YrdC/YwlC family)